MSDFFASSAVAESASVPLQLVSYPNPASDQVWISSNEDMGTVTIEVYDMLGTEQSVVSGQINENEPIELLLPARSGVYNIVVRSISGTRTLRVVREN